MPAVALADVLIYALIFLTLALAFASRKLTQALLGGLIAALQAIPVIGGKLASPLKAVESAIVEACYSIENGADKLAGATWHVTARLLNWTWRELKAHAAALAAIAPGVGTALTLYHGIRNLVHRLERIAHVATHGIKTLEREYHGIEHRVKTLERDITKGIGHDLRIQVAGLETEVTHLENKVIPKIRSIANTAEADVTSLESWVKNNALIVGTTALAGAIAAALSSLGLGWLRCESNPFNNNKNACGLWGDLASVLAAVGIFGLAIDFRDIVKASVELVGDGTQAIESLTILDDAGIQDAAQAVAAAMRAVAG